MREGRGRPRLDLDPETSIRMAGIRQRHTSAELIVRSFLHRQGLRFRANNRDLPGSPDIANRTRRWAVFVHGCFWHAHQGCPKATVPKRNRAFWLAKFRANRDRDARAVAQLEDASYLVLTVWECQLRSDEALRDALAPLLDQERWRRDS